MKKITVATALELGDAHQKRIATKLHKKLGTDADIEFEVDESLLGGISLRVGSDYYDGSLRRKLDAIQTALYDQL